MNDLPINSILAELNQALSQHQNVILSAQPGAGKTTRVPLALLNADWLRNDDGSYKKILMLEPRRIAARNAALFMARSLNENIGQTIGYRMRQDSKVSPATRIEVITEGILTRLLLQDPELANIGLIIFDEHHERSINTDLGLALSLQCQQLFREDLKLLVMSATLDKDALEDLLAANTLFCPGRSFPIEQRYLGLEPNKRLPEQVHNAIIKAIQEEQGSILAFLPGVRDIQQVQLLLQQTLAQKNVSPHVELHPLYGQLTDKEQQAAIQPCAQDRRKVVLATNIAESSLTIEGIRIVVDSGLEKQLNYNPRSAMNALITRPISQASATQRAGRAGRLEAGVCYRLWSQEQQDRREKHSVAEIARIELSDLVLNVAQWGAEVDELDWLTKPPEATRKQAQQLLTELEFLNDSGQISDHGEEASKLGLSPRFAHMLLKANSQQGISDAAMIAALLTDMPKPLRHNEDLQRLLTQASAQPEQYQAQHRQAQLWLKKLNKTLPQSVTDETLSIAQLIALAFPDRIAQLRAGKDQQYLLSSGRGAQLHYQSSFNQDAYLVVTDIEDNQHGSSIIRKAISISEAELLAVYTAQLKERSHIQWNEKGQLVAENRQQLGALIIKRQKLDQLSDQQWQQAWHDYFIDNGISQLPWSEDCLQLKARLQLAHEYCPDWPAYSDQALLADIENWLLPLLSDCRNEKSLKNINLKQALINRLGWDKTSQFEQLIPERIQVPSGSQYKIDYRQTPPVLAVKLQEMFGYQGNPSICNGRINLMLHLLSPARRPLQITQDLTAFWSSSYFEVRKEMRGKYPKHPWPDNPLESEATRFTKKRLKG